MKEKQNEVLDLEEVEDLLKQFSEKYKIPERVEVHKSSHRKEFMFYMVLPEDVISGWSTTPRNGIIYPTFLLDIAKRIAEPHKWSVYTQHSSPEDDPSLIDAWCQATKTTKETITEKEIEVIAKEASEIFKKIEKAIAKYKKESEETEKILKKAKDKKTKEFIADL